MRVPVPTDWDGTSYQCIEIQWPDSAQWDHLLSGLLSGLARGYYWDVPDKAANDAQKAIVLAILARNMPFHYCKDQQDQNNDQTPGMGLFDGPRGNSENEECNDMPGVTWMEWEQGKLYMYFGPCCKVAVEGTPPRGNASDVEGNNPYDGAVDPDTGQPYTGTACGKASAVVDAVWNALSDLINNATNPTGVVSAVSSGQPSVSFDPVDLWKAYLAYVATEASDALDPLDLLGWAGGSAIWDTSSILDPLRKATWKCRLAMRMSDDPVMTDSEISIMRSEARGLWSVGVAMVVEYIIDAFGNGDIKAIGTAGAIIPGDCDCPELHEEPAPAWTVPTQAGWYWGPVELDETGTGSAQGWNDQIFTVTPGHDVYGVMIDIPLVTNQDLTIKVMNTTEFASPGVNPSIFRNTSGNLRGVNIWGPSTATLNDVMRGYVVNSAKTDEDASGNGWSSQLSSPEFSAGSPIDLGFEAGWMVTGDFPFTLRFLYNTGSPSHAG